MTEKIEFLREYAKCGIYHNHGYHNSALDDKLRMMDEAVKELQDLAEQLKQERIKAIDACKNKVITWFSIGDIDVTELINKLESLKH